MICYIIEVDSPNIITHNKYHKCVIRYLLTKYFTMHFVLHGICNRVTNFKKYHVFTILSPKIVFERTQIACSLIMKFSVFMSYFICILQENF